MPANQANNAERKIAEQHAQFNEVLEDYSMSTACEVTARSLAQHGINVSPKGVEDWHTINSAAINDQLGISEEMNALEEKAERVVSDFLNPAQRKEEESWPDEDEQGDELGCSDDDEYDTMSEIFDCDNDDDAHEQALDMVLKNNERD
jgi:hypothetical protein